MYSRIIEYFKAKSSFISSPLEKGKTTCVKSTFPDAVHIDLLDEEIFNFNAKFPKDC